MAERKNISLKALDEEPKKDSQNQETKNKFNEKNYLNVKLAPNEKSKELTIRLLPIDKDSDSPFKTYYTHNLKVSTKIAPSGWKRYICTEKNEDVDHEKFGCKCPCCEVNRFEYQEAEKAKKEGNQVDEKRHKDNSLAMKADLTCSLRCIQRGAEEDGPKFWQFAVRNDGLDPMHLIKKLVKARYDESIKEALSEYGVDDPSELPADFVPDVIWDVYNGKDLKITIEAVYDSKGNRTSKTSISIIDCGKQKPLSRDEQQINAWIDDPKTVYDVFTPKSYEYLKLVCQNKVPYFNKKEGRWEEWKDKTELDKDKTYKEEESNAEINRTREAAKAAATSQAVASKDDNDDIPF